MQGPNPKAFGLLVASQQISRISVPQSQRLTNMSNSCKAPDLQIAKHIWRSDMKHRHQCLYSPACIPRFHSPVQGPHAPTGSRLHCCPGQSIWHSQHAAAWHRRTGGARRRRPPGSAPRTWRLHPWKGAPAAQLPEAPRKPVVHDTQLQCSLSLPAMATAALVQGRRQRNQDTSRHTAQGYRPILLPSVLRIILEPTSLFPACQPPRAGL